jgi:hypothetical protein
LKKRTKKLLSLGLHPGTKVASRIGCDFGRREGCVDASGMWTNADRARYERRGLRYPSDLTD